MIITPQTIQRVTDTIVRESDPRMVILFGSRARGDSTDKSDIDLLIVQDREVITRKGRRSELGRLYRILAGLHVPVDLLLYSVEEFQSWQSSVNHVAGRASREGKVLYARN
jgi:uncharacterized protein